MKLYNIRKPENLFSTLDKCKGSVDIVLPDGNTCSWSREGELIKSLWKTMPGKTMDDVEVRLNNGQDTMDMIDFLMRGNCA